MKTVKVYIETTVTGPFVRDGKYGAALVFIKQNGEAKDLFVQGEETETTHNRSVLLAMIRAMPEPVEIVEKPVDNSEQMEENARNTEAGADSEPVDKSEEEQNPAGSRWEYMKTMESYKMALYMAASVKEMPHMMLNSAEYWKKWLEAEVDENGEELSK